MVLDCPAIKRRVILSRAYSHSKFTMPTPPIQQAEQEYHTLRLEMRQEYLGSEQKSMASIRISLWIQDPASE
jgi:hypothetical protein